MGLKKKNRKEIIDEDINDIDMEALSDSEDEYTESEKKLLAKARKKRTPENYDSDDEVLGFSDADEDGDEDENDEFDEGAEDEEAHDSMESDIEGLQEDSNLPNEKAWGKKKRDYYSTDYVDPDYATSNQKDMAAAEEEEQEARKIQKRLAAQLDEADFGLDLIESFVEKPDLEKDKEVIETDLSKFSIRQKRELMEQKNPEFSSLVSDFQERLTEAKNTLSPFLQLVEKFKCPNCAAVNFIKTKYQLILDYCVNISFYLMLKAKKLPVNSHPVIKRLAQYRQLLNQMEEHQADLIPKIEEVLKAAKEGKPLYNLDNTLVETDKKRKSTEILGEKLKRAKKLQAQVEERGKKQMKKVVEIEEEEDEDMKEEDEDGEFLKEESENEDKSDLESKDDEEIGNDKEEVNETQEKRGITYQIAKNKGLTPYRKKEQRNPRVKHRNKYRKAKIRRKGAVREVRREIKRYSGEISGIKASVNKSIKIK